MTATKNIRWIPLGTLALLPVAIAAQDRLKTMPGYEQAQRVARESAPAITGSVVSVAWADGGQAFEYEHDGRRYRFDVAARHATDVEPPADEETRRAGRGGRGRMQDGEAPARGRQFESTTSPDGALKAFYRDRNLWLSAADGGDERAITTDGSAANRIKYGTASWVYGEELSQRTAMWWSPDSRKIASTACRGRRTAPSCCFSARTGARTSWRSRRRTR